MMCIVRIHLLDLEIQIVVRLDYIGCWKDLIYWQIPQLF